MSGETVHLRDAVDLDTVSEQLLRAVADSLEPSHPALWLKHAQPGASGAGGVSAPGLGPCGRIRRVRIIDLTHPFRDGMPVFPGLASPSFRPIARVEDDGYAMTELHLLNHVGTHIDAPAHQIAGGETLDDLPLERFVTDALTLDVSRREPGPLPLSELAPHLAKVRPGDVVLLFSDNARNYGTEAYWTGWSYPDAACARALIERGISAIGFDGPSADPVDTTTYELHRIWLSAGRMIVENATNLDQMPERAPIVMAPLKLHEANGAPLRLYGLVP